MSSLEAQQARAELLLILAEANATNNMPLLCETALLLLTLCQP
jgi:hypothetical protein